MQVINISNIPNQTISITLDNLFYTLTLKTCINTMACDIYINNILIQSGIRCVSGQMLISYPYLIDGNFTFLTENDDYPFYTEFGVSQSLIYMSNSEITTIVNGGSIIAGN